MICMVRHGQTDQNKKKKIQGQCDFPLNEIGIEQAINVGNYINKNYKFDVIISSPLQRAYKTASLIRDIINPNLEVIVDAVFIERCFGEAEGLDISDSVFERVLNDDYEGLEKSRDIQIRVYNGLINTFNKYKDKNILIVSHSHTIKAALTYIDKSRTFLDRLDNCCLNFFEYDNNIKIKDVNVNPFK